MNIFPHVYCFVGLVTVGIVNFLWLWWGGHSVEQGSLNSAIKTVGFLAIYIFAFRYVFLLQFGGKPLFSDEFKAKWQPLLQALFEGMFYIILGWFVLRLFNHLTMTTQIPFADEMLVRMDQALFIDWNAYFEFVASSPFIIWLMDHSYTGLTPLSLFAFIGLILMNKIENARFFAITFTVTAIVCTVFGMFFPAMAAVETLLVNKELLANFPYPPGLYHVEIIERLRSGEPQVFMFNALPGLTTFPSFHTAAGIVLLYAYRRTFMFYPVLAYTVVMISSTPIYGGHYVVDLIAGTIVALVVCRGFEISSLFKGIFAKANVADAKTMVDAHAKDAYLGNQPAE